MIWLDAHDDITPFPDVERALRDPDGLLAIGGNLSKERLLKAYRRGIFPWYNAGQPILWWSPDPRTVLWPDDIRISRSLAKTLRKNPFSLTMDRRFFDVITACAAPRHGQHGTWITTEMQRAYLDLHRAGYAHSVEVLRDDVLVGGLYGVAVGGMFFGESMFSHMADASKVGLVHLAAQLRARGFLAIDCQTRTDHLIRMGAQAIPRNRFTALLRDARRQADRHGSWSFEPAILTTLSGSRPTSNRPAPDGGQQRTRLDARNPGR